MVVYYFNRINSFVSTACYCNKENAIDKKDSIVIYIIFKSLFNRQ